MFTESNRVQIRRYLGFGALFHQADPRLENAITAVQSNADGGTRPDNSSELAILGYLAQLATIEQRWQRYYIQMQAGNVDEIKIDPLRGIAGLARLGRMYVGFISDALDTRPYRDVFSAPNVSEDGPSFPSYRDW